jgi:lysophospholipase L1-like esterase
MTGNPRPTRVRQLITLGSSSTAGSGASRTDARYPNVVARAFDATLHNLGSAGQTVEQVMDTFLPRALALLRGPPPDGVDVVTLLPFTDVAHKSPQQLCTAFAPVLAALATTHAWVVFGVPTVDEAYQCGNGPLRGPGGGCYPATLVAAYAHKAAALRALVGGYANASVAEIPQIHVQRPDTLAPDGHPNDAGHMFLAQCFIHALAARLGQDAPGSGWR